MATPNISAALAEAKALVAALESHDGTPHSNLNLVQSSNSIRKHLESPFDTCMGWFQSTAASVGMNIVFRLGILEKLSAPGSKPGTSASALAEQTNTHVSLVTRVMRLLILNGIAVETGADEYAHNELSLAYSQGGMGALNALANEFTRAWLHMPEYVKSHQPSDMQNVKKSPFACMMNQEGLTYYEVLDKDPQEREMFNQVLQGLETGFPVLGMFDFKAAAAEARKDPERPFLVDIGGGRGQALLAIKKDLGEDAGGLKFVLQDLPHVIATQSQENLPGVEMMSHDIFTPQVVKNAHFYYMRRLLHDFYEPECIDIVKNTAGAMGPDSRLLICDMLVPAAVSEDSDTTLYWLDMIILTIGGTEKTVAQFEEVLNKAGLELVAIHKAPVGAMVVVEAKLKR